MTGVGCRVLGLGVWHANTAVPKKEKCEESLVPYRMFVGPFCEEIQLGIQAIFSLYIIVHSLSGGETLQQSVLFKRFRKVQSVQELAFVLPKLKFDDPDEQFRFIMSVYAMVQRGNETMMLGTTKTFNHHTVWRGKVAFSFSSGTRIRVSYHMVPYQRGGKDFLHLRTTTCSSIQKTMVW